MSTFDTTDHENSTTDESPTDVEQAPEAVGEGTPAVEEAKNADDAGQAEVQARMDVATEQGFIGQKVDPLPNEAHSLESGPESPTADPDTRA